MTSKHRDDPTFNAEECDKNAWRFGYPHAGAKHRAPGDVTEHNPYQWAHVCSYDDLRVSR